jgi:hypothetical protein
MKGKITILINRDSTTIELVDDVSDVRFLEIKLTPEQLSAALSRMSMTDCEFITRGLDVIGKRHEWKTFEFMIPENVLVLDLSKDKSGYAERLANHADTLLSDGWKAEGYFGSQNSFFEKDGENWARCTIRRYV